MCIRDSIPTSTVAIGQGAQALENGDIVIGRSAKSIVSVSYTHLDVYKRQVFY